MTKEYEDLKELYYLMENKEISTLYHSIRIYTASVYNSKAQGCIIYIVPCNEAIEQAARNLKEEYPDGVFRRVDNTYILGDGDKIIIAPIHRIKSGIFTGLRIREVRWL